MSGPCACPVSALRSGMKSPRPCGPSLPSPPPSTRPRFRRQRALRAAAPAPLPRNPRPPSSISGSAPSRQQLPPAVEVVQRGDVLARDLPELRRHLGRHAKARRSGPAPLSSGRVGSCSARSAERGPRRRIWSVPSRSGEDRSPSISVGHLGAQLHRIAGAEPRHQAQQRHRLHARARAGRAAPACPAVWTAPRPAGRSAGEWCAKAGGCAAQRFDDLDLRRGIGHMVRSAHDMGHAHVHVIHHRGQRIEHLPVAPDQHRVGDRGRVDGDVAQNAVRPLDPLLIELEAPDARRRVRPAARPSLPRSAPAPRGHRPAACPC